MRDVVERVWYGDAHSARASRARRSRRPSGCSARSCGVRDALYDAGVLHVARRRRFRRVSVGNLTVGGTGKTPVAAWVARELRERGRAPAIVLRGYGDDEPLVHARSIPTIPVIVDRRSRRAASRARARRRRDVAVLDDAFQHRRLRAMADVVLVSADRWTRRRRICCRRVRGASRCGAAPRDARRS